MRQSQLCWSSLCQLDFTTRYWRVTWQECKTYSSLDLSPKTRLQSESTSSSSLLVSSSLFSPSVSLCTICSRQNTSSMLARSCSTAWNTHDEIRKICENPATRNTQDTQFLTSYLSWYKTTQKRLKFLYFLASTAFWSSFAKTKTSLSLGRTAFGLRNHLVFFSSFTCGQENTNNLFTLITGDHYLASPNLCFYLW